MSLRKPFLLSLACLSSLAAQAGDQTTLQVVATILPACAFSQKATTLDFGSINPTATTDTTKKVSFGYKCNDGAANVSFAVNGNSTGSLPSLNMLNAQQQKLAYTLAWTPPTQPAQWQGLDGAAEVVVELTGTVAAASARAAAQGSYSDNVTISVTP